MPAPDMTLGRTHMWRLKRIIGWPLGMPARDWLAGQKLGRRCVQSGGVEPPAIRLSGVVRRSQRSGSRSA